MASPANPNPPPHPATPIRGPLRAPASSAWTLAAGLCVLAAPHAAAEWAGFRGDRARGVADGHDLPTDWDVKTGRNVRWKTAIPGLGHGSPIVWGDRIFVTSAVSGRPVTLKLGDTGGIDLASDAFPHSWRVFCLSARDGRILWEQSVHSGVPRARRHVKASQANATPVTDGRTLAAILGSEGLFAFELDGRLRWQADLGVLDPGLLGDQSSAWGHASSPVLFEDLVIAQVDRHRDSFLAAFDAQSGRRVWSVPRAERPVWATPTLHTQDGRTDLIVVGGSHVIGYDPRTGQERWRFRDEAEVKTPTPFVADGLIVLAGGYRGRPMLALRPGAVGDVSVPESAASGPFLAWRSERGGPYTTTPVAYRGLLYAVRDEGIFMAHELATGATLYRERTGATHAASPVASDGRIFLAAEGGELLVLKAGRAFELLARNAMGETCMATPAIAQGTLFVRTAGQVYAIGRGGAAGAGR